jgi:hypothetical protein
MIDLAQSDCLIAFTERPPSGPGRGGRHVELGIALANGLRTMVVGWQENLFHTLVEFYPSWEEAKPRFLPPPPNLSLFAAERTGKESLWPRIKPVNERECHLGSADSEIIDA